MLNENTPNADKLAAVAQPLSSPFHVRSEPHAVYAADATRGGSTDAAAYDAEQRVIDDALAILARRMAEVIERNTYGEVFRDPRDTCDYIKLKLADRLSEVFSVLWLDNRHRLIAFEELFHGTVDGASVHPREVVRAALHHNAAACILAHNHPSGLAEPSAADRKITSQLRDALGLVGVRVLDHLVVGAGEPVSMAARGLI